MARVTPDEATAAWRDVLGERDQSLVVLGDGEALSGPLGLDPEAIPDL
jgi:hypothetical protein